MGKKSLNNFTFKKTDLFLASKGFFYIHFLERFISYLSNYNSKLILLGEALWSAKIVMRESW